MTSWKRLLVLCVILAGLPLATRGVAADLDALMHEFGMAPAGLKPAPVFSLKGIDGKTVALAERRGRPVLLYFWATW
jgi:cytochrome c biogenesis protein CcmG, thiol:disulfide interchange protein DsbE